MTLADFNGFLSFLLNVAGNMMLTWKWRSGWAVRIVAIVSWGIYGWQLASWPIILNAVTFFCINCYGWWQWRKEERATQMTQAQMAQMQQMMRWMEDQRRSA